MAEGGIPLSSMPDKTQIIPKVACDEVFDNPAYVQDASVEDVPLRVNETPVDQQRGIQNEEIWTSDPESQEVTYSDVSSWRWVYILARFLLCCLFFVIVLVSSATSVICLLIMTSDIHVSKDLDVVFRRAKEERITDTRHATLSTEVGTIWGLLTVLCLPYVFTALSCLWKIVTMQTQPLKWKVVMLAIFPDTVHSVGLTLFLFYILPSFDPLTGLFLTLTVGLSLGIVMFWDSFNNSDKSIRKIWIGFTCLFNLACFGLFCYRVSSSRQSIALQIILPISLFFISFCWWDNYLKKNTSENCKLGYLKFLIGIHRPKVYFLLSVWKIIVSVGLTCSLFANANEECTRALMMLNDKASQCMIESTMELSNKEGVKWELVALCLGSSVICYKTAKCACKIKAQVTCLSVPITLSFLLSALLVFLSSIHPRTVDRWFGTDLMPEYFQDDINAKALLKSYVEVYWFPIFLGSVIYMLCVLGGHIWSPKNQKFARTQSLFRHPLYCSVLLIPSLILNRNREEDTRSGKDNDQQPSGKSEKPHKKGKSMIHLCATMWRERRCEMLQLMKSIFRLDSDSPEVMAKQAFNMMSYTFDAHIFFDDAFTDEHGSVNMYVRRLIDAIDEAAREVLGIYSLGGTKSYETPYGERLEWELPNRHKLYVHLKDRTKIRVKKRWSQVMYMFYLLKYNKTDNLENTFILTLDGDVDFQPHSVQVLLDKIRPNPEIGSICGRMHPVGSGPFIWYQKFEYALSHWLQKAAENMFGCVLCSPGCFSLFRGSALMEVMDKYAKPVTEAFQKIQCDLGEDRWLCTLLLLAGYRVEYTAAADSYTFAPEDFVEFLRQRRRWTPSTMANTYHLVRSWKQLTKINPNISSLFIIYQMGLLVSSVVTPGAIFMLVVGALSSAFPDLTLPMSFLINLLPIIIFVILILNCRQNIQAYFALVLTITYFLLMTVVLVGLIKQAAEGGFCSVSTTFLATVAIIFVIAAVLHPQEGLTILYGPLFFLMIPCTSLLMSVFSVANLNDTSWGTRDSNQEKEVAEPHPVIKTLPRWLAACVECCMGKVSELKLSDDDTPLLQDQQLCHDIHARYPDIQTHVIAEEENTFWVELINQHLKPDIVQNSMKADLKKLKNNVFLGFVLINTIYIILIFSLESIAQHTDNLTLIVPCMDDNFKAEKIQPIAMAFTIVFGVFLILQFFGMIAHRFSTLLQIVASEQAMSVGCCTCNKAKDTDSFDENDISALVQEYRKKKTRERHGHVLIEDENLGDIQRRRNRRRLERDVDVVPFWKEIVQVAVSCEKSKDLEKVLREHGEFKSMSSKSRATIQKMIKTTNADIEANAEELTEFGKLVKKEMNRDRSRHQTIRTVFGRRRCQTRRQAYEIFNEAEV